VALLVFALVPSPVYAAEKTGALRAGWFCASLLVFVGSYLTKESVQRDYERVQARGEAALVALPLSAVFGSERGVARSFEAIVDAERTPKPTVWPYYLVMTGAAFSGFAAIAFPRRDQ